MTNLDQTELKPAQPETTGVGKRVRREFSSSQVLASALAAATSFALASKIGIAGSIIGAFIGAAASAAASQIFQSLLKVSGDKIKANAQLTNMQPTVHMPTSTQVEDEESAKFTPAGTRIAPHALRNTARAHRKSQIQRRVALFAGAAAIAVVIIYALIVSFATSGAGIRFSSESAPTTQTVTEQTSAGNTQSSKTPEQQSATSKQNSESATQKESESNVGEKNNSSTDSKETTGSSSPNSSSSQNSTSSDTSSTNGSNSSSLSSSSSSSTSDKQEQESSNSSSNSSSSSSTSTEKKTQ